MSDQNRPRKPGQGNGNDKGNEAKGSSDPQKHGGAENPSGPGAYVHDDAATAADADVDLDAVDIGADAVAVLAAEVETLQAQIADLTDRLLRSHADIENVRKRGEREKQETARYAITNFARDTVGLVDNFQRAMQAVEPEAIEKDPHLKALLDGVAMTEREFINVLERHGIRRLEPVGQPFDPRLQQAVMERQDPSVPNGTVVEVFQPGYTIEDRCLRPAMVVVARGGGKAQSANKANQENQHSTSQDPNGGAAADGEEEPSPDNDNPTV